jgi:transposase InsO family protein
VERAVLKVRDEHPAWGGRKIQVRMRHLNQSNVPAASTITQILRRHGRLSGETAAATKPYVRFERSKPNELWQIDFKGEFRMSNRRNCYPLTLLDDHSRFAVGLVACEGTTVDETQTALIPIFRKYGVPQTIYADNGPPFGAMHSPGRHTRLTAWLMRQGSESFTARRITPRDAARRSGFIVRSNSNCCRTVTSTISITRNVSLIRGGRCTTTSDRMSL